MTSVTSIVLLTLRIAVVATLVIIPIALFLAIRARRWPVLVRNAVDSLCSIPLVLPPTAVGFLLLELLSRKGPFGAVGGGLLFTPWAAAIAAAVMSFPLMYRSYRAAIDGVDFRLSDVARTLGASRWRAFLTVVLPLAKGGLIAGTILAFCRALGEFGATILVAGNIPGRTQTLSLAIYERVQTGRQEEATPLLVLSVVIAFSAVAVSEIVSRRGTRRSD